jgi:hypothetical protein
MSKYTVRKNRRIYQVRLYLVLGDWTPATPMFADEAKGLCYSEVPVWFNKWYPDSEIRMLVKCYARMKCSFCEFKSTSKQVLSRHFSTHLERRVPCPSCSNLFTTDHALWRHLTTSKSCAKH